MRMYQGMRRFGTEHSLPIGWISEDPSQRLNETFAYHTTTMSNTLKMPILVFSHTGNMPCLLSHYRPNGQIFVFTDSDVVRRRMALYHAVTALHSSFEGSPEAIIRQALNQLLSRGLLSKGDGVVVVQSSKTSVWGLECGHAIMLHHV